MILNSSSRFTGLCGIWPFPISPVSLWVILLLVFSALAILVLSLFLKCPLLHLALGLIHVPFSLLPPPDPHLLILLNPAHPLYHILNKCLFLRKGPGINHSHHLDCRSGVIRSHNTLCLSSSNVYLTLLLNICLHPQIVSCMKGRTGFCLGHHCNLSDQHAFET